MLLQRFQISFWTLMPNKGVYGKIEQQLSLRASEESNSETASSEQAIEE